MTLYYNMLAKRYNKLQKNAETDKVVSNNEHLRQMTNRTPSTLIEPLYSNKASIPDKKTDEFKITSAGVVHCNNRPYPLEAVSTGVVAKIPVVLAGLTMQLSLDSVISLPEWVHEIKQIKKGVKITQCTLLHETNTLFIKGLICRTIEYSVLTSELRQWAGEEPFNCTTLVSFNGVKPAPVKVNDTCQIECLNTKGSPGQRLSQRDSPGTCDTSELNQISTAFYNELLFCELAESKIVEVNEIGNGLGRTTKLPTADGDFNCINEKMIIHLTLKILQYQQVAIAPV